MRVDGDLKKSNLKFRSIDQLPNKIAIIVMSFITQ